MKTVTINPLPSPLTFQYVIPELTLDPISPNAFDTWVLRTSHSSGGGTGGKIRAFMGLGWPYIGPGSGGTTTYTYQLSYYTLEGTIKRVSIS